MEVRGGGTALAPPLTSMGTLGAITDALALALALALLLVVVAVAPSGERVVIVAVGWFAFVDDGLTTREAG